MTSWTRSRAASLYSSRETWTLAVPGVMNRRSPISALVSPSATSPSTCRSRSVSTSSSGLVGGAGVAGERGDEPAGDLRREQRVTGGDDPDGGVQVRRRRVLEQEPAGPGPQRPVDVLVEVERRQHQHPGRGSGVGEPSGCRDAVELWHPDVHQHDVGFQAQYLVDSLQAGCRLTDDGEVLGGVHDAAQADADERLVVGDDDPDRHDAGSAGRASVALTLNPPPGMGPASRVPP